ncbi:MAG: YlxM family DNA-binding protein [Eubacterium sp.]|nr:YlxM family DNA-binding protein [Eubacterium sp.]
MEKIVRQALLFDFYGELLTEHQRKVYTDVISEDMSYSEIAEEYGVSRQGIFDLVRRCDKILLDYEEKLRLVEKFSKARESMKDISDTMAVLKEKNSDPELSPLIDRIEQRTEEIIEDF